jgi:hypothetical protein
MPRKSRADHLKVVPFGGPRSEPPKGLDAAEARSWRAIVDAAPDGFLMRLLGVARNGPSRGVGVDLQGHNDARAVRELAATGEECWK